VSIESNITSFGQKNQTHLEGTFAVSTVEGGTAEVRMGCGASSHTEILAPNKESIMVRPLNHMDVEEKGFDSTVMSENSGIEFERKMYESSLNPSSKEHEGAPHDITSLVKPQDECSALQEAAVPSPEECKETSVSEQISMLSSKEHEVAPHDTILCIATQEASPEECKETSVSEQISSVCEEIFGVESSKDLEKLRKSADNLANGLLALGIGRNVTDFLDKSFKGFESSISQDTFKKVLSEELEISRKMAWLAQTDLLRAVAQALSPAVNDTDPLSGIKVLNKDAVLTLVQKMLPTIVECLCKEIEKVPNGRGDVDAEHKSDNSKFCVESRLFTMKCVPFRA
jgi:hypothetical protein